MIWDMGRLGRLCRVRLRENTADLKGDSEILCRCPRTTFASAARTLRSNLTLGVDLNYSTLEEPRLYSWLLIFHDPFLGGYHGVPSDKLTWRTGKSPSLIGQSTINVPFSIANCLFTRGYPILTQLTTDNWDISRWGAGRCHEVCQQRLVLATGGKEIGLSLQGRTLFEDA